MSEQWQQETRMEEIPEPQKTAADILAGLFVDINDANMAYAMDKMQHDEWAAEMRRIDGKLSIFGFRLDHPERFAVNRRV